MMVKEGDLVIVSEYGSEPYYAKVAWHSDCPGDSNGRVGVDRLDGGFPVSSVHVGCVTSAEDLDKFYIERTVRSYADGNCYFIHEGDAVIHFKMGQMTPPDRLKVAAELCNFHRDVDPKILLAFGYLMGGKRDANEAEKEFLRLVKIAVLAMTP